MKMPLKEYLNGSNRTAFCLRRIGLPSTLPKIGNIFSLNLGTTIVGRNPAKSDIFLDSAVHKALISRLHARITTNSENKILICDTSLNGTYVNDRKILDTEELKPGDTVTFGHLKGAVLEPGSVARQPKSEFRFKVEESTCVISDERSNDSVKENIQQDNIRSSPPPAVGPGCIPDLSTFMKVNGGYSQDENKKYKINNKVTIDSMDSLVDTTNSEFSNDELMAYAVAAEDAMENEESDSEMFSIDLPNSTTHNGIHCNLSPSPIYSSQRVLKIQSSELDSNRQEDNECITSFYLKEEEDQRVHEILLINTSNKTIKQANNSKRLKKTPKHGHSKKKRKSLDTKENREENVPDRCAFRSCIRPHDRDELVNWVQCDFCLKWYHLECAGLTLDNVMDQATKFNCGCSYGVD